MANGIWEENHLHKPTTIQSCLTDAQVKHFMCFIHRVVKHGASDRWMEVAKVPGIFRRFLRHIPEEVKLCLAKNSEVKVLVSKYGITEHDDMPKLER